MNPLEELVCLARRSRYDCEDNWYACPLSASGCANDQQEPGVCNCGAGEHNARVDELAAILREWM